MTSSREDYKDEVDKIMRRSKIKYYKPLNNSYNLWHNSKPKRWHKAVASHSPYGPSNPNAFSRFVSNEEYLHHTERKESKLPCGRTIAESWAALRKSWLGFKIARSNGDTSLMTHYASFITKVQMEMGIQVTDFDSDILDEQDVSEIAGSCFYEKPVGNEDTIEENLPDYDSMMDDARGELNGNSEKVTPPRQNIFDRSENSCKYLPQEKKDNELNPKIPRQRIHIKQSCTYTLPASSSKSHEDDPCYYKYPGGGNEDQSQDEITRWEIQDEEGSEEDACYYKYPGGGNEDQSQEKDETSDEDNEKDRDGSVRHSCYYERSA